MSMRSIFDSIRIQGVYIDDPSGTGDIDSAYIDARLATGPICFALTRKLANDALDKFALLQATDSSGSGAKAISGKTLTSVIGTTFSTADDEAIIELDIGELDVEGGFYWVAARISLGADGGDNTMAIYAVYLPIHKTRLLNAKTESVATKDAA